MKNMIIFLILIMISIGSGLQLTPRIIDKIHIITVVGYDALKDDRFLGTIVIPVFMPDKTVKNVSFSNTASMIYENRIKLNAESSMPLESGKLQVALFNMDLAKRGIMDYIDNLERDPTVGSRVNLAIVDGSANDMIVKDYEGIPTGRYFSDLIEHNIKTGSLPKTNLHVFTKRFFSDGIDPILPLLKQKGNKVEIVGVAIFKKDKYIQSINYHHTIVFIMLLENFKRGEFTINKPGTGKKFANMQITKSSQKFTVNNHSSPPKVTIHVKVNGHIREYRGKTVNNKIIISLQNQAEREIEAVGEGMIAKFQASNTDPIGIGRAVKAHTRHWNEAKWKDQYPNVKVDVKAEVTIAESGVIE